MGKGSLAVRRSKHDRTKGKKTRLARQATAQGYYVGRPRPLDVVFPPGAVALTAREPG